ncbi:MAG: hypothetical protein CML20_16710 [Rheinheimera sp.]|uniref:hypothetical protein n=1 Tax=Arsukibacterium sp. UBA3155 TaxID=1946058 RepID=UPI000C985974|nr:hypothetical protein [Arsukibacterium sp. UBA3155]MAD76402.1 hypothetical protein [Rheinheimera sp.]|tara:strand:- start:39978 stop:40694 length:717 start_codon:yes stop_codon:yes gene_type:complete
MKITDEMLSAFLDAALPEQQMELIRQQLVNNEQLTERLAEIAMVDSMVEQHYQQIDHKPMPASVLQLLETEPATGSDVVAFPWWRRAQQQLQQHAAAVACIAVFAGYGAAQIGGQQQSSPTTVGHTVAQLLNSAASGKTYNVDEQQLTPRLSFISQDGDFCRQYSLQDKALNTENIACRQQGEWALQASLATARQADAGNYQTASGPQALDSILDELMASPPLSLAAEQDYLTKNNAY